MIVTASVTMQMTFLSLNEKHQNTERNRKQPYQPIAVSYFSNLNRGGRGPRGFFLWAFFTLCRQYAASAWLSDCGFHCHV